MTKTRDEKLLHHINPANQVGIEIGPLNRPTVTRSMGNVYYVDYTSAEVLRARYADDPNVDIHKIVEVDYIWGERNLAELTQANQPFDYLIASHVIEHVPDLIGWLEEIRSILKPRGILSLAIPDKRQCFDYKRPITRLSELFEAYLHHSRRPTSRQIFDFVASFVSFKGRDSWEEKVDDTADFVQRHSLTEARDATKAAFASEAYYDVHCWVFTPASFFALLDDLAALGLLKFEVVQFYETNGCEFFVSLKAVDNPAYPSSIRPETEAEKPLHLNQLNEVQHLNQCLQEQLQQTEREREFLQERINAMESSKFWRLRSGWFKLKQKLGLPIH